MCYAVGPCWLSILNIAVCTHPLQTPYLFPPPVPSGNHKFILYVCESVSVSLVFVDKFICILSF